MTKFFKSLALVFLCLPLLASAAGNKVATSAMQVTFVVKEACTVQAADNNAATTRAASATAPAVACQFKTPYLLTRGADQAATATSGNSAAIINSANTAGNSQSTRAEAGVQNWTITF